jgi:hypothetical protein
MTSRHLPNSAGAKAIAITMNNMCVDTGSPREEEIINSHASPLVEQSNAKPNLTDHMRQTPNT